MKDREEKKEKQDKEKREIIQTQQNEIIPLIIEANEIASQFGREIKFSYQYSSNMKDQSLIGQLSME